MNLKHLEVLGATLLLSSLSVALAYPLKGNSLVQCAIAILGD